MCVTLSSHLFPDNATAHLKQGTWTKPFQFGSCCCGWEVTLAI